MTDTSSLPLLLTVVGAAQLSIAILNLFLVRLLRWAEPLSQMPLLLRQVFHVHSWFISVTLAIFGAMTVRFASQLANDPIGRWLAVGIGGFWALRTVLQVTYYGASHWRGDPTRTVIHILLLLVYGGMAFVYLATGLATTEGHP